MKSRKKYLLVTNSEIVSDPRPRKMLKWLDEMGGEISVISKDEELSSLNLKNLSHKYHLERFSSSKYRSAWLAFLLLFRRFSLFDKHLKQFPMKKRPSSERWDVIISSDILLLPLVFELKGDSDAKVVLDAREFYPKQFDHDFVWKLLQKPIMTWLTYNYTPKVDRLFSVSRKLCEEYQKISGKEVFFLPSYANYHELAVSEVHPEKIKMLHHGHTGKNRRIEDMIYLMDHLDKRFHLDLILMTDYQDSYGKFIKSLVDSRDNVTILPPISSKKLVEFGNDYDIGLCIFPNTTFNLKYSLSNKIFEFVQSRLCLAIGNIIESHYIIDQYSNGVYSVDGDIKDLASKLNSLSVDDIYKFKHNSVRAAKELSAESQMVDFRNVVEF